MVHDPERVQIPRIQTAKDLGDNGWINECVALVCHDDSRVVSAINHVGGNEARILFS